MNEGLTRNIILPDIPELDARTRDYLLKLSYALGASYDETSKRMNELPVMVSYAFFQDNVAANQSAVALSDGRSTRGYCAIEDGSVVAVSVRTNDPRTAGTLTIEATINGTGTGLTAVLDGTNTTVHQSRQDPGLDVFNYADAIGATITTDAGWLPITADIIVSVGIVFSRSMR